MKIVKRSRMLKNTHVRGILDITVICNKTKKNRLTLCARAFTFVYIATVAQWSRTRAAEVAPRTKPFEQGPVDRAAVVAIWHRPSCQPQPTNRENHAWPILDARWRVFWWPSYHSNWPHALSLAGTLPHFTRLPLRTSVCRGQSVGACRAPLRWPRTCKRVLRRAAVYAQSSPRTHALTGGWGRRSGQQAIDLLPKTMTIKKFMQIEHNETTLMIKTPPTTECMGRTGLCVCVRVFRLSKPRNRNQPAAFAIDTNAIVDGGAWYATHRRGDWPNVRRNG